MSKVDPFTPKAASRPDPREPRSASPGLPWVGRYCSLETRDGVRREGRITRVQTQLIDGIEYELPIGVELNHDPEDVIELIRIKWLTLRS